MKTLFSLVLLLAFLLPCAAADKAIHQLPDGAPAGTKDRFPIDRPNGANWNNFQLSLEDIQNSLTGSVTNIANIVSTTNAYSLTNYVTIQYVTTQYVTNQYTVTSYITNLYSLTNYTTNFFSEFSTITNLYSLTNYTTNFFSDTSYITNLYSLTNWVTNLYSLTNWADVTYATNMYITTNHTDVSFTTNLTVKNLTVNRIEVLTNYVDQLTVTNQLMWVTNTWAGPTNVVNIGGPYDQNFAATSDCEVTGFTNKTSYTTCEVLLGIYNTVASNITVRLPVPVRDGDYVSSHTITNGTTGYFWLRYTPVGPRTNCVFRQM